MQLHGNVLDITSLSKEIAESIMYINNGVEMWNGPHDRFHQSNGHRIFQIKQKIATLSQGSDDVNSYFTKLKTLWDELKEFRPIPTCQCGGMKEWMDSQHHDYVFQFIMGLNDSYSQVKAQILTQDPLPTINKVFSLIIQEERQRDMTGSHAFQPTSAAHIMGIPIKRRRRGWFVLTVDILATLLINVTKSTWLEI